MKKHCWTLAVFLATATTAAFADDPLRVEKPTPKLGDARSYARLDPMTKVLQGTDDTVVSAVSSERIEVQERAEGQLLVYTPDFGVQQVGTRVYTPASQPFLFPLEIGKTWAHSSNFVHPSCGKTLSELKNEVVGWENVTVPAGTFRALRIDSKGRWRNSCGSDQQSFKFWYVPKVKWFVRSESLIYGGGRLAEGSIRELTAYQVSD